MSPAEAKFPEGWRILSLDEQHVATFLDQPTTVARILDPHSPIPEALRSYLLWTRYKDHIDHSFDFGWPIKRQLSFRFTEERDFRSRGARNSESLGNPSQPGHSAHPIGENTPDNLPFLRSATNWLARSMTRLPNFLPGSRCSWVQLRRLFKREAITA